MRTIRDISATAGPAMLNPRTDRWPLRTGLADKATPHGIQTDTGRNRGVACIAPAACAADHGLGDW